MSLDPATAPYLVLVLVGFLPTEIWRWLGLALSRGIDENSQLLVWVRAVATATLAAVVTRLLFFPAGALAQQPLSLRVAAMLVGIATFYATRQTILWGVLAGELVLIGGRVLLYP